MKPEDTIKQLSQLTDIHCPEFRRLCTTFQSQISRLYQSCVSRGATENFLQDELPSLISVADNFVQFLLGNLLLDVDLGPRAITARILIRCVKSFKPLPGDEKDVKRLKYVFEYLSNILTWVQFPLGPVFRFDLQSLVSKIVKWNQKETIFHSLLLSKLLLKQFPSVLQSFRVRCEFLLLTFVKQSFIVILKSKNCCFRSSTSS